MLPDGILRFFLLFMWTLLYKVDSITLPAIHWNATNPMFKASNNDHIIEVNLNDEVDFECPYYSRNLHPEDKGFYIIYQVSYDEYRDCFIATPAGINMIVNCSSPHTKKRFTIIFESFSPVPNGQEFQAGGTYHYISTSSGYEYGVANQQGGACYFNNMRLTIRVCCQTTTDLHADAGVLPYQANLSHVTTLSPSIPPPTDPHSVEGGGAGQASSGVYQSSTIFRALRSTLPTKAVTPSSTVSQVPTYSYRWHPRTAPPWIPPKYTEKPADDSNENEVLDPVKHGFTSGASSYRCPSRSLIGSHSALWSLLPCQLAQILYILLR